MALGVGAVGLGALAATAGYAATGTTFNVFTPAFVTVIVVVGTSDLVHLVHRVSDHCAALGDAREAAVSAAREVGLACALTSTTTAIGFFALLTTEIPPIRIFGLATGIGVLLTFACTFLVAPPVLAWLGPPSAAASRHAAAGSARMTRLGEWVLTRPRRILVVGSLLTVALAALASTLTVQHRILDDVRSSEDVARAQDFMEAHLGAVLPLQVEISFPAGATDPLAPEAPAATAALADWLRSRPEVGYAVGLTDLVGPAWEALSGAPGLPDTREAAAQTLLLLGLAGEDPTTGFLVEDSPDGSGWRARIACRAKDIGNEGTMALVSAIEAEGRRLLGPLGATVTPTGVAFLAQEVNVTLTRQFAGSFAIALGLITVIWLLLTRSPRRTAVALVPNVLPLVALLALMAGIGLALKPSTAMVLSVGLGMAVNDTIHFLARYEQGRREGRDAEGAVLAAYLLLLGPLLVVLDQRRENRAPVLPA